MTRMRRSEGFTLIEVMIAVGLTAILMASVLSIVRVQLRTFEQNDQILRAQQNERATMDFLESIMRRACGGVSGGSVGVAVSGATAAVVPCVRYYDGANIATTALSTGSASSSDAIEVIYATGTMTTIASTSGTFTTTTSPTLAVNDVSNFALNDYVLVSDASYANGYLLKITGITVTGTGVPLAGTLAFGPIPSTLSSAAYVFPSGSPTLGTGTPVFKAYTYSIYVAPSTLTNGYANMLVLDTNGVASTNHLDWGNTVQPIVEGVVDLQVAIGFDNNVDGTVTESTSSPSTDEWIGNASGETVSGPPLSAWNVTTTPPQPRQIRLSLTVKTLNSYSAAQAPLTAYEDRPASSYPSATAGTSAPKYRQDRIYIAPRAWNLTE